MTNNMTLKAKLLVLMILPILGMLFFASININDKNNNLIEAKNIYNITLLNIKISAYIHQLQKERGLTSGFLSSNGARFKTLLLEQRETVDKFYNNLSQYLNSMGILKNNSKFVEFKEVLTRQFSGLTQNRKKIINFKLTTKQSVAYFSMINDKFLDFIYLTSKETSNTKISSTILAYTNFLLAKEKTGIQRALMTEMLLDMKSYEKNKINLNNIIVARNNNISIFLKLIDDEDISLRYMKTRKNKVILELKIIEKNIINNAKKENIDVSKLFDKITLRINKQEILADLISKKLLKMSQDIKNRALNQIRVLSVVSIVILMLFIILIIVLYRNINSGIKNILDAIHIITLNGVSKYKDIKIITNDEIGKISTTINIMAADLKNKEQKAKLKNEELENAKKDAEKNGRAKSEFLANMSHEIRTPLNAVLGFIDILKDETRGRKSHQYVEIIDKSSRSLLQIIEDILDFSKIESGKLDIDKVDFNSIAEFEVITHLFDAKCSQRNIALTLNIDDDLPKVINTDPLRIKQVIANLLSNAVKFTKEGTNIEVTINYANKFLNISVRDEGIGIAPEKLSHVFEAFGQEDSSTTRKYGGTGLGLSISSELVKLLGGELKVKSELDVGSKFYFSIPITIGKELKIELNENIELNFNNKKILLVEDNLANQMFMKVVLKKMNLKFDIANDGLEAVEQFKLNNYDAILMDENMPNMGGIESTKIILELEKEKNLQHTPIIALTANALKGDRERFLSAGMDEYLTKPVNKKILVKVLNKFIKDEYNVAK